VISPADPPRCRLGGRQRIVMKGRMLTLPIPGLRSTPAGLNPTRVRLPANLPKSQSEATGKLWTCWQQ
jgi:hypothetical protein